MKGLIKSGVTIGLATPVAINVELGFIPNSVEVYNASDGTLVTIAYLIPWVVPFSSGGTLGSTAAIVPGSTIRGLISGATAQVTDVQITSGTFSAGNAVGSLLLQEGSLVGTFGSENIIITNPPTGPIGTDDATVTVNVVHNLAIAAAAALATGTSAISRYEGVTASNARGFTIGVALAAAGKVLRWRAFRDDS